MEEGEGRKGKGRTTDQQQNRALLLSLSRNPLGLGFLSRIPSSPTFRDLASSLAFKTLDSAEALHTGHVVHHLIVHQHLH